MAMIPAILASPLALAAVEKIGNALNVGLGQDLKSAYYEFKIIDLAIIIRHCIEGSSE